MLVLDTREVRGVHDRQSIQDQLTLLGVPTDTRALELGDVLWVARVKRGVRGLVGSNGSQSTFETEIVLDYVVERKRLDDFVSSIQSGRFREQKVALRLICFILNFY
jgi:crossover junction endonuclease MUS81